MKNLNTYLNETIFSADTDTDTRVLFAGIKNSEYECKSLEDGILQIESKNYASTVHVGDELKPYLNVIKTVRLDDKDNLLNIADAKLYNLTIDAPKIRLNYPQSCVIGRGPDSTVIIRYGRSYKKTHIENVGYLDVMGPYEWIADFKSLLNIFKNINVDSEFVLTTYIKHFDIFDDKIWHETNTEKYTGPAPKLNWRAIPPTCKAFEIASQDGYTFAGQKQPFESFDPEELSDFSLFIRWEKPINGWYLELYSD